MSNATETRTETVTSSERVGDFIALGRYGGAYSSRWQITAIDTVQGTRTRRDWNGEAYVVVVVPWTKRVATMKRA